MERYRDLKGKEIVTPAKTWCNAEGIVLSEISQSQRDPCCMRPSAVKFIETESRVMLTGWREWGAVGQRGRSCSSVRQKEPWARWRCWLLSSVGALTTTEPHL